MATSPNPTYVFGRFRLDAGEMVLLREGQPVPLAPKALEILLVLVEHSGHVVEKEELLKEVWPDTFVEEGNLTVHVSALRKALGEGAGGEVSEFIETVPRRGYRFLLPVEQVWDERPTLVLERRTETRIVHEQVEEVVALPRAANRLLLWAAGALALALVAGAVWWNRWTLVRWVQGPTKIESVAVLPLANLTGDAEQDYLADGLTESLITELGRTPNLRVIARTSAMQFKGSSRPIPEIASALGVDAVMEGSVLQAGGPLRVTVKLVDARTAKTFWTASYERASEEASSLPWEVARDFAVATGGPPGAGPRAGQSTHDVEAYALYLQGRHFSNLRRQEALDSFEKAIARDPHFAPAYLGLAETYIWLAGRGVLPTPEASGKARASLLKALEIDPEFAEAQVVLALIKSQYEFDFAGADRDLRAVLPKVPNYANGQQWYAAHLQTQGRFEEAIAAVAKAQKLDPLSLPISADVGRAYYFARQYDRAIGQYRKTLQMDPKFLQAHYLLALAYLESGRAEEAVREIESATTFRGAWLGYAYARAGRTKDASQVLQDRMTEWQKSRTGAGGIALIHAGLGDRNKAFEWLEQARQDRDPAISMLNAFPYWDSLRPDPRFRQLLQRVGLPEVAPRS